MFHSDHGYHGFIEYEYIIDIVDIAENIYALLQDHEVENLSFVRSV